MPSGEISTLYICTSLTSIVIPESVTSIGFYAFYGCTGLKEIYCYAEETPQIESSTFNNVQVRSVKLYVPKNAVEKYRSHRYWKQFQIEEMTGTDIELIPASSEREGVKAVYDMSGRRQNALQRGLNIIRMDDGTTRKVLIR